MMLHVKYKLTLFSGLLIFLIISILSDQSSASEKVLDIQFHRQNTLVWCWGASTAMVVEYITGQRIEDCEILSTYDQSLGGPGQCCWGDPRCLRGAAPGEIENILGKIYKIHSESLKHQITYDEIVRQINEEKPIIIWLWRSSTSAHIVVISGYRDPDIVVVLDPMLGQVNVLYSVLQKNWQTGEWRDTIKIASNRKFLPSEPISPKPKDKVKDKDNDLSWKHPKQCYSECRADSDSCNEKADDDLDECKKHFESSTCIDIQDRQSALCETTFNNCVSLCGKIDPAPVIDYKEEFDPMIDEILKSARNGFKSMRSTYDDSNRSWDAKLKLSGFERCYINYKKINIDRAIYVCETSETMTFGTAIKGQKSMFSHLKDLLGSNWKEDLNNDKPGVFILKLRYNNDDDFILTLKLSDSMNPDGPYGRQIRFSVPDYKVEKFN